MAQLYSVQTHTADERAVALLMWIVVCSGVLEMQCLYIDVATVLHRITGCKVTYVQLLHNAQCAAWVLAEPLVL